MDTECIGKAVSLDCGALGFYQGVIDSFELEEQTLTIINPVQNGRKVDRPRLTLRAVDIQDLTFVDPASSASTDGVEEKKAAVRASYASAASKNVLTKKKVVDSPASSYADGEASVIQVTKKKSSRGPAVAESLARGRGGGGSGADRPRSSNSRASPRKQMHYQQQGGDRVTPSRYSKQQQARDEDCFGEHIDDGDIGTDFDFEGNLAMFDKRLVFEEIDEGIASNQPDVVRLVDSNRRRPTEPKYKNDENVLLSMPGEYRPIETGEVPPPGEYATDSGLIVPAVSYDLRSRLEAAMAANGIGSERVTELVARAGAELSVQLFGGAHRLNPENSHQVPLVVILCGPSRSGVFGLATARHLASLGVRTIVYVPDLPHYPENFNKEFALYKLSGAKSWAKSATVLPKTPVDLIIVALEDHEMWQQERSQPWLKSAKKWAEERARAPVMAIDPPAGAEKSILPLKLSLLPGLPLWHQSLTSTKLYMANLGVPKKVYKEVGIKYSSPFGAKNVVALHRT